DVLARVGETPGLVLASDELEKRVRRHAISLALVLSLQRLEARTPISLASRSLAPRRIDCHRGFVDVEGWLVRIGPRRLGEKSPSRSEIAATKLELEEAIENLPLLELVAEKPERAERRRKPILGLIEEARIEKQLAEPSQSSRGGRVAAEVLRDRERFARVPDRAVAIASARREGRAIGGRSLQARGVARGVRRVARPARQRPPSGPLAARD